MSANRLKEKATVFAEGFDMKGRRGMVGIFPSSLTFHWEPMTSYTICWSQYKIKPWDPLVQNVLGISRQGEQRCGPC